MRGSIKMRKIFGAVAVIIFAFLLTSCTDGASQASKNKTGVPADLSEGVAYEIVSASYRDGDILLLYPKISDLADREKQTDLNSLILEDAKNIFHLFDADINNITVEYDIRERTESYFIVDYIGQGFYADNPDEPMVIYYMTKVDVENGKILTYGIYR